MVSAGGLSAHGRLLVVMLTPEHRALPPYPVTSTCVSGRTHEGVKGEETSIRTAERWAEPLLTPHCWCAKWKKPPRRLGRFKPAAFVSAERSHLVLSGVTRPVGYRPPCDPHPHITYRQSHPSCNADILIYMLI